MSPAADVEIWLDEGASGPLLVGSLRPSFQGGRNLASTSFQYATDYLNRRNGYALSPDLPLVANRQFASESQPLFGAFADAAPDEWGRKIIEANHSHLVREDPSLPRAIGDFDFLVGVADRTRAGALRLRNGQTGAWLASDEGVANLHDLDRILAAAARYEADEASDEDIAYLNDVATSPGGARPKANVVLDDGQLAIAKLPHSKDGAIDVERWEALALTIEQACGVQTPRWSLHSVGARKSVLLVTRFDRDSDGLRAGYLSAASALELGIFDQRSVTYEQFSDTLAEVSASPRADLREMYIRIAITVLINNVDDHWRNHGFVHSGEGWRLSPVFDVNPSRRRGTINSRPINAVDDPRHRDIRNLLAVASSFRLSATEAADLIRRTAEHVITWREIADQLSIDPAERELMRSAFDEDQLSAALSFGR